MLVKRKEKGCRYQFLFDAMFSRVDALCYQIHCKRFWKYYQNDESKDVIFIIL